MSDGNQGLIAAFRDLVTLATLDEGGPASFRVRAYENALNELTEYRGDLSSLSASELTKLDGIGKSTAKKIREFYDDGRISKLEDLRAKYPPAFVELTKIPGLGPKSVLTLRAELGVENIDQLRVALDEEKIRGLKGFGAKTEENIRKAIERASSLGKNTRRPIAVALPLARIFVSRLLEVEGVGQATFCGSLRRFRETIGDIDIVVTTADPGPVMDAFTSMEEVSEVVSRGDTKASIVTDTGFQADLRVVDENQFGAAILYFTGSKAHNIKLRQRAIQRGWTLNEYGLTDANTDEIVAQVTEEDIYRALDMDFVPPPMREDHGECEAAASSTLPNLTNHAPVLDHWVRDTGSLDLAEVAKAAKELGLARVVVAGTGKAPTKAVAKYKNLVPAVELATTELGGSVDLPIIARFDAPPTRDEVEAVLATDGVVAVAGISGRRIGEREPADLDVGWLWSAIAEAGITVIVDGRLQHLDPPAEWLRRALDIGVAFAAGSGAETAADMAAGLEHARSLALRGWVPDLSTDALA